VRPSRIKKPEAGMKETAPIISREKKSTTPTANPVKSTENLHRSGAPARVLAAEKKETAKEAKESNNWRITPIRKRRIEEAQVPQESTDLNLISNA